MNSSSFLVVSLGFSVYSYVICKVVTIYFFFPNLVPCISFSCLIAVARTCNKTVLNESGKSGLPCLLPAIKGKASNLLNLSMMLAVGLSYVDFTMYIPSTPSFPTFFYNERRLHLSNALSVSI